MDEVQVRAHSDVGITSEQIHLQISHFSGGELLHSDKVIVELGRHLMVDLALVHRQEISGQFLVHDLTFSNRELYLSMSDKTAMAA